MYPYSYLQPNIKYLSYKLKSKKEKGQKFFERSLKLFVKIFQSKQVKVGNLLLENSFLKLSLLLFNKYKKVIFYLPI